MAYERVSKLIPQSSYKLKSPYAMSPQYITIHNTANDATALNEIAYMTRNTAATGYHVAIDDKYAVEAIPFSRNAWHCGDSNGTGNRKSIGIEICYSKSGGAKYAEAEANAIEYTAHLLKQYGWGIDRVKWHRDWSGKNCPHRILDEGRASAVRGAIARKLAELNAPAKPAAVKPVSKPVIKPTPKPVVKPKPIVKEEETDMHEVAIVIGSLSDYSAAEIIAIRMKAPIYPRSAVKGEIAKHIIVVGGDAKGLTADKITDLSGDSRFDTYANVDKYLSK